MEKSRIVVFAGPNATLMNSPPLVTSKKARIAGERCLMGQYDHLVPQVLYEPVTVKIKKFTAHPLEREAKDVYLDDGREYYEVTLNPEDGPYPLPYVARRRDGSPNGKPFEASDLKNSAINFGGRQTFYPDASRIFMEIDRSVYGRGDDGEGNLLAKRADYDFVRALPSGGYPTKGEKPGVDYFPYRPEPLAKRPKLGDLATVVNCVQSTLHNGNYVGALWLESTMSIEETSYWLNLLINTELPIACVSSQRVHGRLSNDGNGNILDAVDFIVSGKGKGLGVVAIIDQCIFASRELKKADGRPGGYKVVGGHGGILGSVKLGTVSIWYKPNYKHTSTSDVNVDKLPEIIEVDGNSSNSKNKFLRLKNQYGYLNRESIPAVYMVKHSAYAKINDHTDQEIQIMALINHAQSEENSTDQSRPKLHGIVFEGNASSAKGDPSESEALRLAAFNGLPVVRVCRADPGGKAVTDEGDFTIEGNNLDSNKARLLLIASMLKLGSLPKAKNPESPTSGEIEAALSKLSKFQEIFESH